MVAGGQPQTTGNGKAGSVDGAKHTLDVTPAQYLAALF